jgi:hypothetical protein
MMKIGDRFNEDVGKVNFLRLIKNAQTQVELCEIPFAGAPEILRP